MSCTFSQNSDVSQTLSKTCFHRPRSYLCLTMAGLPHTMPESDEEVQRRVEEVFVFKPGLLQIYVVCHGAVLVGEVITVAPTIGPVHHWAGARQYFTVPHIVRPDSRVRWSPVKVQSKSGGILVKVRWTLLGFG